MKKLFLSLVFVALTSHVAFAQATYVNGNAAAVSSVGTVSSGTVVTTTGNFLIGICAWHDLDALSPMSTVTVADTAGNTWHDTGQNWQYGYRRIVQIWYAYNITGNAANNFTCSSISSQLGGPEYAGQFQFSGVVSMADPLDIQSLSADRSTTTTHVSDAYMTSANVLLVGVLWTQCYDYASYGTTPTLAPISSCVLVGYRNIGSAESGTQTMTDNDHSDWGPLSVFTFDVVTGGGGGGGVGGGSGLLMMGVGSN